MLNPCEKLITPLRFTKKKKKNPLLAVQRGVPAGARVRPGAAEPERPSGGAGGADGGLHRLGLHQPRAAAGHPRGVPAGAPGHAAAGARLGGSGMLSAHARTCGLGNVHLNKQML